MREAMENNIGFFPLNLANNLSGWKQLEQAQMNNLIGPIDQLDWTTLLQMKKSVNQMKKIDPVKYQKDIRNEAGVFEYLLVSHLPKEA